MNKFEKDIAKAQLSSEEKTLKELQQVFKKARKDVQDRITELNSRQDMQNLQSIVYQKKYQQAILGQINEALADLSSGQYKTVEEYLVDSYDNGYIGMMYSLQSQGIPMTVPINDRNVVKALTTDSQLSKKYYKADPLKGRLDENVTMLKQRVRSNLSRGIIAGKSWLEVAVDIASGMNNPFDIALKDAMRIARTEGHRVHQQGYLDAGDKAKEKGADILKQWDATMDSKTRPAHQQADGQIVEWDEYFTVGGEKMKAPSVGGSAKNVVNCRCQLLQRARWALDEEELETLQKRAEFFGLDKAESFEDFKQKYLKLPEKADTIKVEETFVGQMRVIQDRVKSQGKATADDIHEAGLLVKKNLGLDERNAEAKKIFDEIDAKYQVMNSKIQIYQAQIDALVKGQEFDAWEAIMNPDSLGYKNLSSKDLAKIKELQEKQNVIKRTDDWKTVTTELAKAKKNLHLTGRDSADNLKQVLSQIKSMGHQDVNKSVKKSSSEMRKYLVEAMDYYPTSWVEKVIDEPLSVKKVNRGYFDKWNNLVALSGYGSESTFETAIHELGHCFEHKISISNTYTSYQKWGAGYWRRYYSTQYPTGQTFILDAERDFYKKRTEGEDLKWLGAGYAKTEKTRKDNFISPYMGKDYEGNDFELVSMGFQYAYTDPDKLATDPDMESWIYGILALY
jgi:hypothetical protein